MQQNAIWLDTIKSIDKVSVHIRKYANIILIFITELSLLKSDIYI